MYGFSVLENDTELIQVTWGDRIGVAHVNNIYGKKHIKAMPLYLDCDSNRYDIPFDNVLKFFEERTVPRTRINIKEILKVYGLREYDPYGMVKQDHGVSVTDNIWVRFVDEDLVYADVKVR